MSNIAKWAVIALAIMGAYLALPSYIPQVNSKAFDFGTNEILYKHILVVMIFIFGGSLKASKR